MEPIAIFSSIGEKITNFLNNYNLKHILALELISILAVMIFFHLNAGIDRKIWLYLALGLLSLIPVNTYLYFKNFVKTSVASLGIGYIIPLIFLVYARQILSPSIANVFLLAIVIVSSLAAALLLPILSFAYHLYKHKDIRENSL